MTKTGITQQLRFSRFMHKFPGNGINAFYHSLNLFTVFVSDDITRIFSCFFGRNFSINDVLGSAPISLNGEIRRLIAKLRENNLIINAQYNEMQELERLQKFYLDKPEIGILYLSLTDSCNISCSYCFIEGALPKNYSFSTMTKETAKKAIDFYNQTLSPDAGRKTIIFYGGEPLVNKKVFQFCLEYIARLKDSGRFPDDVALTINTNGTLITKEIARLMKKHNIAVSISLDGPKDIHDYCRKNKQGDAGTFDKTISGYRLLKSEGVNVGVSCTVGEHNIDKLPQIVDWFIDDLKINFLGLNQLTDLPGKSLSSNAYAKKFAEMTIKSFLIARKKGLYEDRMMRKVEAFANKNVYPFDCAGCGRQLVIMPDGSVGTCHAYTGTREYFSESPMEQLNLYKEKVWQEWCRRSPLGMPQCFDCPSLGICGGGCPYNAHINYGSIWEKDRKFCIYANEILKWMIWDLYEQASKKE